MATIEQWIPGVIRGRNIDYQRLHADYTNAPEETVRKLADLAEKVRAALEQLGCPPETEADEAAADRITEGLLREEREQFTRPFALMHARLERANKALSHTAGQAERSVPEDSRILRAVSAR